TIHNGAVSATGTIIDNNTAPTVTGITPSIATEGDAVVFDFELSNPSAVDATYTFTLANGTAGDLDYTITNVVVTVPAGATTGTVSVPTTQDSIDESDETFTINNGTVTATGTIIDDDDTALIPPTTNDIVNATLIKNDKAQSVSPLTGSDADGVVVAYIIRTLPDPASGILTLNGIPLFVGQELTVGEAALIQFTPNSSFNGNRASFTVVAKDNTGLMGLTPATIIIPLVEAESPSILLVKEGVFNDVDGNGFAEVGETITYNFTITNTGNIPLTNVTIIDTMPGLVISGNPIALLQVGEANSTSIIATYVITQRDLDALSISNKALVQGTSPNGAIVESSSTKIVDLSLVAREFVCAIKVFNALSPNDDGKNDEFFIEGLECYPDNKVEIYNRWGVLVFEREKYNNKERAFRGVSEGRVTVAQSQELPTGTYFYILKYSDLDKKVIEQSGYLYINR
ncbi:gliding motility-associated C-terminal domain-containing protein, partial [Flavobacterium frigoris]